MGVLAASRLPPVGASYQETCRPSMVFTPKFGKGVPLQNCALPKEMGARMVGQSQMGAGRLRAAGQWLASNTLTFSPVPAGMWSIKKEPLPWFVTPPSEAKASDALGEKTTTDQD